METEKKPRNPNSGAKKSSLVASKIKAKILNTSSFFKASLKGNNKALARALADQAEKNRQLIKEIVLLRQRIHTLSFDLSIQQHQKRQMFSILQKFYSTFYKGLAQATNLMEGVNEGDLVSFCEDEGEEADHAEGVIQGPIFGGLLQAYDKPHRQSKIGSQRASQLNINTEQDLQPPGDARRKSTSSVTSSVCLVPMRLSSKESQHSAQETVHQKTLVCSTDMEMTAVDSAVPIVTVDTKTSSPPPLSEDTEGGKEGSRPKAVEEASVAVGFSERQGTSLEVKLNVENTNAESALGTGVGEIDLVGPCRKTYVTSRRNSRLTLTSHNSNRDLSRIPNLRKTYIITPKPCMDLVPEKQDGVSNPNTCNALEETSCLKENAAAMQPNTKMDELRQCQNSSSLNRKTYVISDTAGVKRSLKADDLAGTTDREADSVVAMVTVYDAQQHETFTGPTLTKNTDKKIKTLEPLSTANEGMKVRRGGKSTSVGLGSERSVEKKTSCIDAWCDFFTDQDQQERDTRVISTLEDPNSSHADIATETQENCDQEAVDLHKVSSESPMVVKPWKISDFLADGEKAVSMKPRKKKTGKCKEKKAQQLKNRPAQEKRQGNVRKSKMCTDGNRDHMLDEHESSSSQCKIESGNAENFASDCTENKALEAQDQAPAVCPSTETCYTNQTGDVVHFTKSSSGSAISTDQPTHNHRRKCRDTFIIKINENCISTDAVPTSNRASLKSTSSKSGVLPKRQTLVYQENLNKSVALPRRETELLTNEIPPWESLDFGSADPFLVDSPASSPPSRQPPRAIEIYQEASPTIPSQSPEGRAMKSLTNTNCITDAESGRSRRRGALVSYKEPALNAKMRRGDKFSDTQFLSSPVHKMRKTKKMKRKA